jgi:hypothetical protein
LLHDKELYLFFTCSAFSQNVRDPPLEEKKSGLIVRQNTLRLLQQEQAFAQWLSEAYK